MKNVFRFSCLFLIILTMVFFPRVAVAKEIIEKDDISDKISNALHAIEPVKSYYNLENVDFCDLKYSDPICAYEYTKNGLEFSSFFYPISYKTTLIGWVIIRPDGLSQFDRAFVSEINDFCLSKSKIAIIYDSESSYLYDGNELYKAKSFSKKN